MDIAGTWRFAGSIGAVTAVRQRAVWEEVMTGAHPRVRNSYASDQSMPWTRSFHREREAEVLLDLAGRSPPSAALAAVMSRGYNGR